ncbi:DUF3088 domain-containing protein [Kaistia dalseonensis]|uniref:DUF3088 domain-containing protein n=1 Tax=Kaistia dalseonensis TaxID=410840 RepID=A0ABU0H1T4_9HYPH|nr:DUF3088 domain-containing protein [Kaistia dalseonensis]MCX5493702.1 DUF3088 domain-containing protein [Kaistia dalseonensis]MDQ0436265.1 hypothetical protein [Kaistia dalseonensis]
MSRDKLFLIEPGFEDPTRPGERFVCPYCNQVEGLLAAFPDLATRLDVVRVPFARPRQPVIDLLGETNQSLPVLVLADGEAPADAERHDDRAFVSDTRRILELLSERHGFPRLHD